MFVSAGTAMVLAFCLNNSLAQNDAPAPAPAPAPVASSASNMPPPGPKPMPPKRTARPLFSHALADLRMVKAELQHSQDDFDGHKDSAIEACDKTIQELSAILKTMPAPPPPQRAVKRPAGAAPAPAAPPAMAPAAPPAPASSPAQP